jgi:hypothetical protein
MVDQRSSKESPIGPAPFDLPKAPDMADFAIAPPTMSRRADRWDNLAFSSSLPDLHDMEELEKALLTTLRPANAWDVLVFSGEGDQRVETLLAAAGRALLEWNRFEAHLPFLLEALAAYGAPSPVLRRAYHVVNTFEQRLDMLRSAVEVYAILSPVQCGEVDLRVTIDQKWRQFGLRRDEIAAGKVLHDPLLGADEVKTSGYVLVPLYYDPARRRIDGGPDYVYNSKDLDYYAREFGALGDNVLHLVEHVEIHSKPWWHQGNRTSVAKAIASRILRPDKI